MQSSVCVLHITLLKSALCLCRTSRISHLRGFMMFRMLLLKAAVYVGSEQQASSYSLEINTNTGSWCGFVFSKLYIFFSLPLDFILRVEMLCFLTSTALPCYMSGYIEFIVDTGNLDVVVCSAIPWVSEKTFQGNLTVSKPSCLSSFWDL